MMKKIAVGACLLFLGLACWRKNPALKAGEEIAVSCESIAIDSECAEFVTTDPAKKAELATAMQVLCKSGKTGTICPTSGIVGSCRLDKDHLIGNYYSNGAKAFDVAKAKMECTRHTGSWVDR